MNEQFLNVALFTHFLHVIGFLKPLELTSRLCKSALASLFFKDENDEGPLLLAFRLFATTMEQHRHLVNFEHHI